MTRFKAIILIAALGATACSQAQTPALDTAPIAETVTKTVKTVAEVPKANTWQAKHVDAKGALALLSANANVKILDIRTSAEIQQGYIDGAIFADFNAANFETRLTKLDRAAPYIVHCRSGGRSTKSLTLFKELGFTNITHMDGGLDGWKKAGLPLITPSMPSPPSQRQ